MKLHDGGLSAEDVLRRVLFRKRAGLRAREHWAILQVRKTHTQTKKRKCEHNTIAFPKTGSGRTYEKEYRAKQKGIRARLFSLSAPCGGSAGAGMREKTPVWSQFYAKSGITLPRQARDKHRES